MHLTDVLPDAPSTTDDALALFDAAPAVTPDEMLGTWRGAELPTGHPLDGLLEASGWWGKQFLAPETVHPLPFPTADGAALWAVNPALVFGGLGLATRLPALRRGNYTGLITKLKAGAANLGAQGAAADHPLPRCRHRHHGVRPAFP